MEVNILLFDDFDTMDAFGPAEVFGSSPQHFHVNYLSVPGNIVNSMQGVKVWTEPLEPEELQGIVVIPGGRGARRLLYQDAESLRLLKRMAERSEICMMIGSGSLLLMQTGSLFRRSWVADGKYYSSSCTMTGIDMALSIVADMVDLEVAERIAQKLGHAWDAEDENVYQ